MNPTKPQSVRAVYIAALALSDETKRREFLDHACKDDSDLRTEVDRLLAFGDASSSNVLDKAVKLLHPSETVDSDLKNAAPSEASANRQIGCYKLLQQLGEGGMGEVFVAEQMEPVRRLVALKLIKRGMDSTEVIARFEAERQALAMMNHPNIARVLEAGTSDDGRPYFVMDLVRGIPIMDYCDQHRLSTRERLELFVRVCEAVQHAHLKGIIHRDLKPSNILVELHDVLHVPKIIDFGVAKAINQRLTERTLFTQLSQMIGTPLYMSPEQAELSGLDVDTRSDVYSLGVLLYELLTGTTPFDKETLRQAGFDEMRRIIREDEPQRPSDRISTLRAEQLSTLCERQQADAPRLLRQVKRELDWVVMKTLEKDRRRRYESASALAEDIRRYLRDEPVTACPPSVGYRTRKLLRRHRGPAVAASLLVLGLVSAAVLSLILAVRERELAQRNGELAERRRVAQEGINRALAEVVRLRGQAGSAALSAEALAHVNEQMQRALALAETAPADEPSVKRIQQLAATLDQEQRDRKLLAALDAAKLASATARPDQWRFDLDASTAQLDERMAVEGPGNLRRDRGTQQLRFDWEARIPRIQEALATYGLTVGQGDPRRFADQIADCSAEVRVELFAALEDWRDALLPPVGLRLQQNPGGRVVVEYVAKSLAQRIGPRDQLVGIGQADGSPMVDVRQMALPEIQQLLRGEPGTVVRLEVIAESELTSRLHQVQRDLTAAWLRTAVDAADSDPWRGRVREVFELLDENRQRVELEKLADQVDLARQPESTIARLAHRLEKVKAEERAIQLLKRLQQRNPAHLWVNHGLGDSFMRAKPPQIDNAVRYLSVAVALRPESAGIRNNLATALFRAGKYEEAIAEYHDAIRLEPNFALPHLNLGVMLVRQGKLDEAIACYCKAIEVDPKFDWAYTNLGIALKKQGKFGESLAVLRKAVELVPQHALALNELAWLLATTEDVKLRDPKEALVLARRAVAIDPSWNYLDTLAEAAFRSQQWQESLDARLRLIKLMPAARPKEMYFLAMTYWHLGNKEEARKWYTEAVAEFEKYPKKYAWMAGIKQEADALFANLP